MLDQGYYSTQDIPEVKDSIGQVPINQIHEALKFLSVIAATTTVSSGVRTESDEISVPAELEGKRFKITDVWISAISSTADTLAAGDNLLVGLIIGGKPLLFGAKQSINGKTISLDMLPVPLIHYAPTLKIVSRKAYFKLLSELFVNIRKLKIVYSHKSTNTVHYLIYLTIGGVIL